MQDNKEVLSEIERLKKERNAVVLVHNYQLAEVQQAADFVGDSLELARKAAGTDADVIVFCGVHFMAETAAILSPDKTVLLPKVEAGCAMADMVDPHALRDLKKQHPEATVICYVNTTAAVKAECDIACTSANAALVVESVEPGRSIIFVPDENLGANVSRTSGRPLMRWSGYCPVHDVISVEDIERARRQFPGAEVWAHPECRPEVIERVDRSLSTGQMVKRARQTDAKTVVVATEIGMLHRLRSERPDVAFVPATEQAVCVDMKLTRLEDVRDALALGQHVVTVSDDLRARALLSVERMLELG